MARIFPRNIHQQPAGQILVEEIHPGFSKVYFVPPEAELKLAGLDSESPELHKKVILEVNARDNYVVIHPLNTSGSHKDFLKSKYKIVRSIVLDGFDFGEAESNDDVIDILEAFPSGFVKDFDYGLGLLKDYRFIIEILEEQRIQHLVIAKQTETKISRDTNTCTIRYAEFDWVRKQINNITSRSRIISNKVKRVTANNGLAYFLKEAEFPQKTFHAGDSTLEKLIARTSSSASVVLSKKEQKEALNIITENNKVIAQEHPEELIKLHNEIELVTLEVLIQKFEEMLSKTLSEAKWQALFNTNPFILSLAFGYPIIKIQDQAHVGGRKLSGDGEKIADFLLKNRLSSNAALFEIKTPQEPLLDTSHYRKGVYPPSRKLSGAVNQLLDQKHKFETSVAQIKNNSRIYDLESYSVHGVLIIGTMPSDLDKQKSFELFRGNSKNIMIITFDELFRKLKELLQFLSPDIEANKNVTDRDLPF